MPEFVETSPATATGTRIAVDIIPTLGTGTDIAVQRVKIGFGTDGAYNDVATGTPLDVRAATGAIYTFEYVATATTPNPIGGFWAHDATATGNPVYVGGIARSSRPAVVSDGDVAQIMTDQHGRIITTPIAPRGDVVTVEGTVSATSLATLATGISTLYADLVTMVLSNGATTVAKVRIRSSSTATKFAQITLAGDGGGISFTPARPALQAVAAGDWDLQLASAITGQVSYTFEFIRTN